MMEAIRSRDFTLRFSLEKLKGEERLLAMEINAVITEFRDTLLRQEALYGSYETLLNQVNAALLVDDCHGKVLWMNEKAIRDLCGFRIHALDVLATLHPSLPQELDSLLPGQHKLLQLRISVPNEDTVAPETTTRDVEWNVSMVKYSRLGSDQRLFSIENIQSVLQQSEVVAQKKLVRVLTHEIMNSLSPIISLSDTLIDGNLDKDESQQALEVIKRRSEGLLDFVENYRQLSKIAPPQKERVTIGELIGELQSLFADTHIIYNIEDPQEEIVVDRAQIIQVLINLLKNAKEAVSSQDIFADNPVARNPQISLSTKCDRAERIMLLKVTDNGAGILPEVQDRIFIPFFTTKPTGSGIGLSICRQIITNHSGTICVSSRPGHTEFIISLPT